MSTPGLHLVFVLNELRIGGAEVQASLLAGLLVERGFRVTLAAFSPDGELRERTEQRGVSCHALGRYLDPTLLRTPLHLAAVRRFLCPLAPDVLLPFTHVPNVYTCLTWETTGAKACIWNQRNAELAPLSSWVEQPAVRRASTFTANSPSSRDYLVKALGVAPDSITMVPNGVEATPGISNRATWRQKLGIDPFARTVLMLGNLRPPKDHATVLKAWRLVLNRTSKNSPAPVLVLAGRHDHLSPEVAGLARDPLISNSIRLAGYVADVHGLIAACDLAVLSSLSEGMPNGLLEPMAHGLAVIASDIPGTRAALPPEQAWSLFPCGDSEALATKLTELIQNKDLAGDMSRQNRLHVEEHFSPGAMCDIFERLIRETLAKARRT